MLRSQSLVLLSTLLYFASTASFDAACANFPIVPVSVQRFPLLTLQLRGGDGARVVPGVAWSQQADSLLLKVDMPQGVHSSDGLKVTDSHITWKEGEIDLDLALSAEVNSQSASMFCDGYVAADIIGPYWLSDM